MKHRRAQKPPKICYFCGQTGSTSKEHAWPQWLGMGAVVASSRSSRKIEFRRTSADAFTELPTEIVNRKGSVLTARIREVCERCNNWSVPPGLETAVQLTGPPGLVRNASPVMYGSTRYPSACPPGGNPFHSYRQVVGDTYRVVVDGCAYGPRAQEYLDELAAVACSMRRLTT